MAEVQVRGLPSLDMIRSVMLTCQPNGGNIVSSVNLKLKSKLALKTIASDIPSVQCDSMVSKLPGVEYAPMCGDALIMRFSEPRTHALVSASGKVVCSGATSEHDAILTANMVASVLSRTLGYKVEFLDDIKVEGVKVEGVSADYAEANNMPNENASLMRSETLAKKGEMNCAASCWSRLRKRVKLLLRSLCLALPN